MISVRRGGVWIELDRDVGVVVLTCQQHDLQDAISLSRENLGSSLVDFFDRHEGCASGSFVTYRDDSRRTAD